jgi:hypothetical protein
MWYCVVLAKHIYILQYNIHFVAQSSGWLMEDLYNDRVDTRRGLQIKKETHNWFTHSIMHGAARIVASCWGGPTHVQCAQARSLEVAAKCERTTSCTLHACAHVSTWRFHEGTSSICPLSLLWNHASSLNQIERMHGLRKNRYRQCSTSSALLLYTWTAASTFHYEFWNLGKMWWWCASHIWPGHKSSLPCSWRTQRDCTRLLAAYPAAASPPLLAYKYMAKPLTFSLQNTQTHSSLTTTSTTKRSVTS